MEIAIGVLAVATLYGAGLLFGTLRKTDPPGGREPDAPKMSCEEACKIWDHWRQQRCNAEAAARVARERADTLLRLHLALLATAAGLVAAAYAAYAIPFVGPAIAAALFAAAAVVGAAAVALLGQSSAAAAEATRLAAAANEARQREAQARNAVRQNCSTEETTACFSRPSPC